ncbi:MAG: sensor histidine kinase KdpD [Candidatus Methylacidiphilales bacterium]|nr:sensor histidine kinase KdpD [Candidatus Methylacidiphilales bacterium]
MNDDLRPDPDALLARLDLKTPKTKKGRLKIFLGMCPGVGKTYAMLEAARAAKRGGLDVVAGVVETHGRIETVALLEGLEVMPRQSFDYKGAILQEMDLDGLLRRRPEVALVDELAHSNAPGSRHPKRYLDVRELLDAGIDVWTTVNIQHIESRTDVVRQITGVAVRETVPDSLVDDADEIELVDLAPEALRRRLAEGKVYLGERAHAAAEHFFKSEQLTALREMALRYTAEKVDQELRELLATRRIKGPWKSHERLLVAVGASPYAESLIRWTRRQAGMLDCPWTALCIDTGEELDAATQSRLGRNLALARQLGADVVTQPGTEVAGAVLEYAREHHITQIVLGKTEAPPWWRHWQPSFSDRIIRESGKIDVLVVRPEKDWRVEESLPVPRLPTPWTLRPWLEAAGWTAALTGAGWIIQAQTGYWTVSLIYLLGIVLAALRLPRGPVLALAVTCALVWDYLFIPPFHTFSIRETHDVFMFLMFLVVALVIGHLTSRLREREKVERVRERRTAALLAFTQTLALEPETGQALRQACVMLSRLFQCDVGILRRKDPASLVETPAEGSTFYPGEKEFAVARWVYQHRQPAGRGTDTLATAEALHLPLFTPVLSCGVLLVKPRQDRAWEPAERAMLENFAAQLGLFLQRDHIAEAVQRAEVAHRSSALQKNLLDSVSHELKTPLATLQAAAEALSRVATTGAASGLADEITAATSRLHRIVNHLLEMTRLDSGKVEPRLEWCDPAEIVGEAVKQLRETHPGRPVQIEVEGLPWVLTDPELVGKILFNLLHNAALYTPAEMPVKVRAAWNQGHLRFRVRDHGPGLGDTDPTRLFEKFYRPPGSPAGGSGLGLALARGFARTLGGDLSAANAPDGGAVFRLDLPSESREDTPTATHADRPDH